MYVCDYRYKYLFVVYIQIQYYTTHMIALANSCQALVDVMVGVKTQFWRPGSSTPTDATIAREFDGLLTAYQVCNCIFDDECI